MHGAGDGTRTHDILLGKQTLYRLSYTRMLYEFEFYQSPVHKSMSI